jgi:hypothetical protein
MGPVGGGGDGRFSVTGGDGSVQTITVPDPSLVWKQGVQGGALEAGDVVSVRGERQPDGSLQVSNAWVDIHTFQATILQTQPAQLSVSLAKSPGRSVPITTIPITEVATPPAMEFVQGGNSQLGVGDIVQIVGFGSAAAGSFVATRVIVLESAAHPSTTSGPDDQVITGPDGSCTYYGITSYFDCNGYAACDNCVYCSSSYDQMAWPNLLECGGAHCNSGATETTAGARVVPVFPK